MFEDYYREPDAGKRKAILDGFQPAEGDAAAPAQRKTLFDLRYKKNKKGGYDDLFLGCWLDLKFIAEASDGRFASKRNRKIAQAAVHQLCLDRREEFSEEVLYAEMCHLTLTYISSCTEDSRYKGVFWGLGTVSDERLRSRLGVDLKEMEAGLSRYPEFAEDFRVLKMAIADTAERLRTDAGGDHGTVSG